VTDTQTGDAVASVAIACILCSALRYGLKTKFFHISCPVNIVAAFKKVHIESGVEGDTHQGGAVHPVAEGGGGRKQRGGG